VSDSHPPWAADISAAQRSVPQRSAQHAAAPRTAAPRAAAPHPATQRSASAAQHSSSAAAQRSAACGAGIPSRRRDPGRAPGSRAGAGTPRRRRDPEPAPGSRAAPGSWAGPGPGRAGTGWGPVGGPCEKRVKFPDQFCVFYKTFELQKTQNWSGIFTHLRTGANCGCPERNVPKWSRLGGPVENEWSFPISFTYFKKPLNYKRRKTDRETSLVFTGLPNRSPTGPQPGPIPTSLFAELLLLSLPDGRAAHLGGMGDFFMEMTKKAKRWKIPFGCKKLISTEFSGI